MPKLTHKPLQYMIATALLCTGGLAAQSTQNILEDMGRLIDDALFFSDQYITPITDAAVYQSSSGWITTPKERDVWEVSFGIHTNIFSTPKSDRLFVLNNSDLTFFQLEEGNSVALPTALGDKKQVYLTGMLGDSPVRLETPQGINMETVAYPYLQGSVGLPYGMELVVKYSPHVKLKKSEYQVYGFGLKHNISRYFKSLEAKRTHIAVLAAYSKEDVSFNFLNVQTNYGSLGINRINGLVDTFQFQVSASQEFWDNLEFMGSFIANTSDVKYRVSGETGSIEQIVPLQSVLNQRLREIYKTRVNYIGEFGTKYKLGNFSIQGIVAFGKFVNTNVSLQYLFK